MPFASRPKNDGADLALPDPEIELIDLCGVMDYGLSIPSMR